MPMIDVYATAGPVTENLRFTFTDKRRGWTRIKSARVTRTGNNEYQAGQVRLRKALVQSAGLLASQRHSSTTPHRPGLRATQRSAGHQ
jgi:hypothetical protein